MKIIVTGQLKDSYFRNIEKDLLKYINKRRKIEIIELKDEKIPDNASEKVELNILKKEGSKILEKVKKTDYVVCLCIEGKSINSNFFKNEILKAHDNSVFIIGGSLGLSDEVKNRANLKISFSNMTFTHQMMRIILLEEIKSDID